MSPDLAITLSSRLEEQVTHYRTVYGERWETEVDKATPGIREVMRMLNTKNPLLAGIAVGRQLRAKGDMRGCCLWMALCAAYVMREEDNQTPVLPA